MNLKMMLGCLGSKESLKSEINTYIMTNKSVLKLSKQWGIGHKNDSFGVRDMNIIININKRLFALKGSIYEKAAFALIEICKKHPFQSGNRRTAYIFAITILYANLSKEEFDIQKKMSNFFKPENVQMMTEIRTTNKYSINDVVKWLKK